MVVRDLMENVVLRVNEAQMVNQDLRENPVN